MKVVGVDGCPGGWVAMSWDTVRRTMSPFVYPSFNTLLAANEDAAAIAVDIPIGLIEGSRQCDLAARQVLGRRRSSVFPAPDPRILHAKTYAEASALAVEHTSKGVSQQAFAIFQKIREVNEVMTPELQNRVVECHPEVSFWAAAGKTPMEFPKKTAEGFAERRALLQMLTGSDIPDRKPAGQIAKPAGADDVLDATIAAWTARRVAESRAGRLPETPETDSHGLRVEIVY